MAIGNEDIGIGRDFLGVLAYQLVIAIEKTLLDHDVQTPRAAIRDSLKTHQICTVVPRPTVARACLSAGLRPPSRACAKSTAVRRL